MGCGDGSTIDTGRIEDWQEITSRFLRIADLGTPPNCFSREGGIVRRREDGSEAVSAQLESTVDVQIDR